MKKTVIIILSVLLAVALAGCIYHFVLLRDARTENAKQAEALGTMKLTADDSANEIAALKASITEREDSLAALTAELEQLKKENAALSAAAQEKDGKVAALDQDAAQKIAQAEKISAEYDALNEKYAALVEKTNEMIAQLNQTVKAQEDDIAALRAEKGEQDGQIETLNAAVMEKDEAIAQLTKDIEAGKGELESSAAQIGALNTTVAENAQTIEALRTDIEEKKSEIDAKAAQIETLNAVVLEKEKTIESLGADIEEKKGEIEAKTAEIAAMGDHVEAKKSEIDTLNAEIETLNAAIKEKEETIRALDTDVKTKKDEIDALNAEIGTLNAAVKEKEETIAALNGNVDAAEHAQKLAEIEALSADLAAQKADIENKTAQIDTLTAVGKEKDQTIDALNADITAKAADIAAKVADIDTKAAQIEALTAAGNEKDQTIEALTADIAAKAADIEGKIAEINTLTGTVAAREKTIAENNDAIAGLKTDIDHLNGTLAAREKTIEDGNAEIAGLKDNVKALVDTVAAREKTIEDNGAKIADLEMRLNIKNPLDAYGDEALDETTLYGRAVRLIEEKQWKQAQMLLLNSTDEKSVTLLKSCNAQCFLADLQTGLKERWALAGEDTSVMSNEKTIEYYTSLVNAELNHIGMYASLALDDETLTAYAGTYISALNNQLVGIEEFFSKDTSSYYRYWQEEGYNRRAQILFLINREYGLDALADSAQFKSMVNTGEHINLFVMAERSLAPQLLTGSFALKDATAKRVELNRFTLENTSGCTLESVTLKLHLYDAAGKEITVAQLYHGSRILPGAKMKTYDVRLSTPFASYSIECAVDVQSAAYKDSFSFTVVPLTQFGWDGAIQNAPKVAQGEPLYALENVNARWTMHTAWGAASYVPSLQFDVRNTGTEKSGEVVIRCEFVNEANQTLWSEETSYVTGQSDAFLNPGDAKRAFLYSSVGYGEALNPVALADVSANVYINDVLVSSIKIKK